jgi:hypothetical protein
MNLILLCGAFLLHAHSVSGIKCYDCWENWEQLQNGGPCFEVDDETATKDGCDYCATALNDERSRFIEIPNRHPLEVIYRGCKKGKPYVDMELKASLVVCMIVPNLVPKRRRPENQLCLRLFGPLQQRNSGGS